MLTTGIAGILIVLFSILMIPAYYADGPSDGPLGPWPSAGLVFLLGGGLIFYSFTIYRKIRNNKS